MSKETMISSLVVGATAAVSTYLLNELSKVPGLPGHKKSIKKTVLDEVNKLSNTHKLAEHNIDIVVGMQYGGECKGKVVEYLLNTENYDVCIRVQGGDNAGQTLLLNGNEITTHLIPSGIIRAGTGTVCIVGRGCVVNPFNLEKELSALEKHIPNVREVVKLSRYAHLVLPEHIDEDFRNNVYKNNDDHLIHKGIGSTLKGIGPAYASKARRVNPRLVDIYHESMDQLFNYYPAELVSSVKEKIDQIKSFYKDGKLCGCDLIDEIDYFTTSSKLNILVELAQGVNLSIDSYNYPYVTSSPVNIGVIGSVGLSPGRIRTVYHCAKAYTTYLGNKNMQEDDPLFDTFAKIGTEIGYITGRTRECMFLNLDNLIQNINSNLGKKNVLIVNKLDVLETVNNILKEGELGSKYISAYNFTFRGQVVTFEDACTFKVAIEKIVTDSLPDVNVVFSSSAHGI